MVSPDDLKQFIIKWNLLNPVDRWWRERYKVPFNSPTHRISSFIDQMIEFQEEIMYNDFLKDRIENEDKEVKRYVPGSGLVLVTESKISEADTDEQYENLSLDIEL